VDRRSLQRLARKLGAEGKRGWLTPEGEFFESEKTPGGRIQGLMLGGHEQAAIDWLGANRVELYEELENHAHAAGYECWEETDGEDVIKNFMYKHGFIRISPA
jgi:hypothetical protein